MGLSTLNGHGVTSARTMHSSWGCWYASVSIDGEAELSGAVDLVIADLTLRGAVVSGGPDKGRAHYRVVGGAGGWGRTLPRKSYVNDAGVKYSSVLGDAAREAGETLDATTLPTSRIGTAWVRPEGRASAALQSLAPTGWYVGEDGVTRLGARAPSVLPAGVTHGPVDRARRMVTLASDTLAAILPGLVVDGMTAVDVQHEVTPDGLRSTVWGSQGEGSRSLAAFGNLLEQLDPDRRYRGLSEYRVLEQVGERLDLQPVRVSSGMPELQAVRVRPGVSGVRSTIAPGCIVLVGFVDASQARPVVLAFSDAEGDGFIPPMTHVDADSLRLGLGARKVAAEGDTAGGFTIVAAPTQKVLV